MRKAGARVLRAAGYEVVTAESAEEALELAAQRELPFDVIVSDVVLPGISGIEMIERFNQPEVRVVFTSGYADAIDDKVAGFGKRLLFLPKPFSPDELTASIERLLGRKPS